MSKGLKSIVAILMVIGFFMPKITPNQANANPQQFGRPPAGELGSITVVRVAGEEYPVVDGHLIPNVPIRVVQVELTEGAVPSMTNLSNPEWVNEHVIPIGTPIYRATDENGEAVFDSLPQGIWLVQELESAVIDGVTVINPIEADQHFADFIVGVPRWLEEDEEWEFDIRVYPKSEIPDDGVYKEAIYYTSNVAR